MVAAFLGVLASASCNSTDSLAPSDEPATGTTVATQTVTTTTEAVEPTLASVSYSGLPFGAIGLWSGVSLEWGPGPFTASQNFTDAGSIVTQISVARNKGQRLILAMTGGPSTRYTTNGKFDFTKWKNKMNTFNTSAIKSAVAAGVSDGTIIGNQLIDEPETARWGGNITKTTIDQMASYAKQMFPSLPMGLNHGPPGYKWRASERYKVLDYVLYQYNHWITSGNVTVWRDAVLAQAKLDGVTPALSLNILDGGVQDRTGSWDCPTTGKGTYAPNCRMTADQVSTWGKAIGGSGCFMMMWKYDGAFMSKTANKAAFQAVASYVASKSRRSCARVSFPVDDTED
jgi:hypothetical protein